MGLFKQTNKRILGGLAAAAMLAGGLALGSAGTVAAAAVNDGKVCEGLTSGKIDTPGEPQAITITVADYPAGNFITGYCVKAGSEGQVGGGPVYVKLPQGTTTVTFGHPSGKAVSHYSFSYAPPAPPENPQTPEVPVPPTPEVPVPPTPEAQVTPTPEIPVTPIETPAAPTPDVVVAALPPVQAPAQAVSPAAALPAQALPSTGIDGTGVTALIALLMTSLGGAALFVSRRYDVTN